MNSIFGGTVKTHRYAGSTYSKGNLVNEENVQFQLPSRMHEMMVSKSN